MQTPAEVGEGSGSELLNPMREKSKARTVGETGRTLVNTADRPEIRWGLTK